MLDPTNDLLPPPSSPTNSSISSSDLDTESTGSFFHDRSTTLGTLMGVSFPAVTFRAPSQRRRETQSPSSSFAAAVAASAAPPGGGGGSRRSRKAKSRDPASSSSSSSAAAASSSSAAAAERRRRWWSLCRGDADARPSSLGHFLEVERRLGDGGAFYGAAAELEEAVAAAAAAAAAGEQRNNGRVLFADGRVLPPAVDLDETASSPSSSTTGSLCRFPVLLTGICSGCVG